MKNERKFGLLKSDLKNIISILKNNYKIEKAILFGSRAKGNFQPGSDVDIAIVGQNLDLNDILNANFKIDNLSLPNKIDIVIYNRISEKELIDHINRVGITIMERSTSNGNSKINNL